MDRLGGGPNQIVVVADFEGVVVSFLAGPDRSRVRGGVGDLAAGRIPGVLVDTVLGRGHPAGLAAGHRQHEHLHARGVLRIRHRHERDPGSVGRPSGAEHSPAVVRERSSGAGRGVDQEEFPVVPVLIEVGAGNHHRDPAAVRREGDVVDPDQLAEAVKIETRSLRGGPDGPDRKEQQSRDAIHWKIPGEDRQ